MNQAGPLRMIDFTPRDIPLEHYDISQLELCLRCKDGLFSALRDEAPVHYCEYRSLDIIGR